jgi:hypothetical protein
VRIENIKVEIKSEEYHNLYGKVYGLAVNDNKDFSETYIEAYAKGCFRISIQVAWNLLLLYNKNAAEIKNTISVVTGLTMDEIDNLDKFLQMKVIELRLDTPGNS